MQDTYYSIIFGTTSPAELFEKLNALLIASPAAEQVSLASQIPKLLPKYAVLPEDSVKPYFSLLDKILELLPVAEYLAVCLHAFTSLTPRAYTLEKCYGLTTHLFEFVLANFEVLSGSLFFSQTLPPAAFCQACTLNTALILSGTELSQFSTHTAAPVQCVVTFLLNEKLKDFPNNVVTPRSLVENWLGYLLLLTEIRSGLKKNGRSSALDKRIIEEGVNYLANVLPFKEKDYIENRGLFSYTEHIFMSMGEYEAEEDVRKLAKNMVEEYFMRFQDRSKNKELLKKLGINSKELFMYTRKYGTETCSDRNPLNYTEVYPKPVVPIEPIGYSMVVELQGTSTDATKKDTLKKSMDSSDSDDDLKCIFTELNLAEKKQEETKEKPLLPSENEGISIKAPLDLSEKLSELDVPCVSSLQLSLEDSFSLPIKSQGKAPSPELSKAEELPKDPFGFMIECKAGMVKSLAYVDKEYLSKEFSAFAVKYVEEQDKLMQSHSDAFHKHFKHQYVVGTQFLCRLLVHLEARNRKKLFPSFALHPFPNSYGLYFVGGEEIELCIRIRPYYNIVIRLH